IPTLPPSSLFPYTTLFRSETLVQSLNRFRSQPQSMTLLEHLKAIGLNITYLKDTSLLQESIFNGKTVCVTGTLELMTRKEIKERSEEHTSELQSRFDLVCR